MICVTCVVWIQIHMQRSFSCAAIMHRRFVRPILVTSDRVIDSLLSQCLTEVQSFVASRLLERLLVGSTIQVILLRFGACLLGKWIWWRWRKKQVIRFTSLYAFIYTRRFRNKSRCDSSWMLCFPRASKAGSHNQSLSQCFESKGNDIVKSLYFACKHVGILVRRNRLRSRISASDAWGSHTALTWPVVLCFLISSSEAYECPFSDPITVERSAS